MVSERRTDFEKTDIVMLVLVVVLTVFGLAMLLSASEYNGRVRFGDSAYYFKKQLFAAALGLGIMYLIMNLDYHFFVKLAPMAYLVSVVLSAASLIFSFVCPINTRYRTFPSKASIHSS